MKKAIVFKAVLPELAQNLELDIQDYMHKPLAANQLANYGFTKNALTGNAVFDFAGGYSFTTRIDKKDIPKSMVDELLGLEVAHFEENLGRGIKQDEKRKLKADILEELVPNALHKTRLVTSYYNIKDNYLFVEGAQGDADIIMALLRKSMGSLKTTTIHIDASRGLAERLNNIAGLNSDLGGLNVGTSLRLIGSEQELVTYKDIDLNDKQDEICGYIEDGYQVKQLNLTDQHGCDFVINERFQFSSISFPDSEDDYDQDDAADNLAHETSVKVIWFSALVDDLCKMFDYEDVDLDKHLEVEVEQINNPDRSVFAVVAKGHVDKEVFMKAVIKAYPDFVAAGDKPEHMKLLTDENGEHSFHKDGRKVTAIAF